MTRLLLADDPGAARPAKNATAPGLPNQTRNHSKGRTPMVETTGPAAVSAAREDAVRDQAYRAGLRLWSAVVATGHDFATRSAATGAGEDR